MEWKEKSHPDVDAGNQETACERDLAKMMTESDLMRNRLRFLTSVAVLAGHWPECAGERDPGEQGSPVSV
ncbi:MAG: hypothetical protein KJ041_11700, partial [Gammaproteobacteria bacterium]|nr:hypothetical protein [Gammaproteobacteria bacterium]